MRHLEGALAAAAADGAAGRAAAKDAQAALAALEWRVDQVGGVAGAAGCWLCCWPGAACCRALAHRLPCGARLKLRSVCFPYCNHAAAVLSCLPSLQGADATIGTIKALEARQDRLRSEVQSTAATAHLADAKVASLAAEVARLQRRVHAPTGSPLSPGRRPDWRLY